MKGSTITSRSPRRLLLSALLAGAALVQGVRADDILETSGFSSCNTNADIKVQKVNIKYNNADKTVSFDVAGTSTKIQNVTATLNVTAYGTQIYSNSFDPCDQSTFVTQLCPVPAGTFSANGTQAIPAEYASLVPAIAFQIPDIAAMATLTLESKETKEKVACIQSQVTNGKTASVPAVSYVAAAVAGVALVAAGASAISATVAGGSAAAGGSSVGGTGTVSPSFTEVFGWFQGLAMNGMLSVNYPKVYRSFTKSFGFSTGLIPWTQLQVSIDNFRGKTGGNLTLDSVEALHNATLVFPDGSEEALTNKSAIFKRAADHFVLLTSRQISTSVTTDTSNATDPNSATESIRMAVKGIQAYVNLLSIPSANTFMTVLLIVAIVIAAIAVGILLVKVILEIWALFGSFPKSLAGFRKHYWGSIARAITSLILLLYGVWVLYCVFQFTNGDSWAAKTLAGVTLGLFTGILFFFSWKIWSTARKLKNTEGDASGLYENKSIWVKYSLFYESYRKDYWWIFVPTIIYMFVKGFVVAAADGKGMAQTIALLSVEGIMLILLLWSRPYERKAGNVINIIIQVVRVLSVAGILVFVEEFGIQQTTQTVTGVVLIAVQSAMTGILAILIIWNALLSCCRQNPHRQRRKDLEKMRDMDTLTPLDARNSLLLDRKQSNTATDSLSMAKTGVHDVHDVPSVGNRPGSEQYLGVEPGYAHVASPAMDNRGGYRPLTPASGYNGRNPSSENLMSSAAPVGRQPTLPNVGYSDDPYGGSSYRPAPPPSRGPYDQGGYGQGGGYNNYNNYNNYGGQYRGGY
ncbi:TRP-domain-containing protein [Thozetella sp. PMI_491]|nr:TRP-domain-containing protein [Thozetella sp. PMI_491]